MGETSVLDQNKPNKQEASTAVAAEPKSEQSVLSQPSSPSAPKKPITFYKKAWFWLIIIFILLGIGGLVTFLVIQSNITAEAIENYDKYAKSANTNANEFDSAFRRLYSYSNLAGYYEESNPRSVKMRNECLGKYDVSEEDFKAAKDMKYLNGETAVEELGSGDAHKLSDKYKDVSEKLKDTSGNIESKCKELLEKALTSSVEINVSDYKVSEGSYSNSATFKVTIKNIGDSKHKYYFRVYALKNADDDTDDNMDYDYFYTNELAPGESQTLNGDFYFYSSDRDYRESATLKVGDLQEES